MPAITALLRALLALVAGLPPVLAEEQLRFASTYQRVQATAEDNAVQTVFPFVNVSSRPVTIRSVTPRCSCTSAHLDHTVFRPGESGEIITVLTIGDLMGLQLKAFDVATDQPDPAAYVLTMEVSLPPTLVFNPDLVAWGVGAQLSAKTIRIRIPPGYPHRITGVRCAGDAFTVAGAPEATAGGYAITVTPRQAAPVAATIEILTDSPRVFTAFATIDGPAGSPSNGLQKGHAAP